MHAPQCILCTLRTQARALCVLQVDKAKRRIGLSMLPWSEAEAGRSREDIRVYIMPNRPPEPDFFERYEDAGVDQVIVMVGGRNIDSYLPRLDKLARMASG